MTAEIMLGDEMFDIVGLRVVERNYLDVYPYDTWKSNEIPMLSVGMQLDVESLTLEAGETSRPNNLTESELITAMDKNGIGKDHSFSFLFLYFTIFECSAKMKASYGITKRKLIENIYFVCIRNGCDDSRTY